MRITFLGTGTSHGIPVVACPCPVCSSRDSRDSRYRSSILVEEGPTRVLVDAGPEFRLQALRAGIQDLDAVLITHAHADHIHGLDDLRPYCEARAMPVYGDRSSLAELAERFAYVFRPSQEGGGKPKLDLRVLDAGPGAGTLRLGTMTIRSIPLLHGELPVSGWRFGDFAYLTDCSSLPQDSLPLLEGVRWAAIDALRLRPHPTHFSVDEALAVAAQLGVERVWLTHICHDLSHEALEAYCAGPGARFGVAAGPAHDGLVLDLPPKEGSHA